MTDWTRAQCSGLWEWFFPLPGETPRSDKGDVHRKWVCRFLCSGCALKEECAELGREIENGAEDSRYSSWAIWGGLDRGELLT